jgi:hypothetical protein
MYNDYDASKPASSPLIIGNMELQDNLSLADIDPSLGVVDKVASALKPQSKSSKNAEAVAKTANGQYFTLRPYLKNMITIPQYVISQVSGKNIAYFAVLQLPAQAPNTPIELIIPKLQALTQAGVPSNVDPTSQAAQPAALQIVGGNTSANNTQAGVPMNLVNIKAYLPYIIVVVVIAVVLYFVLRKK